MNPVALKHLIGDPDRAKIEIERELCERSLFTYLQRAWSSFDPARFQPSWHHEAIAEHLEAVAYGEIRRLLINIPPRSTKTVLASIAFPTWVWALKPDPEYPLIGGAAQFLCVAYGSDKAEEDGVTARRLVASDWYQARWGSRYRIAKDRDNQSRYDTDKGGYRISVGIMASVLGRGGNIKIIDDAMKPDDPESDLKRVEILKAYDETLSSRENDPTIAAEIVIAQRLDEKDLPGHVLTKYGSNPDQGGFCHVMIPAEYDPGRHCVTVLGWQDPRGCDELGNTLPAEERALNDGKSFWPARFTPEVIAQRKLAEGTYSWASKYNQAPIPRGGGIIKPEWWNLWPPGGEEFDSKGRPKKVLIYPEMDYIVAYLDTALTSKEENDPSGLVVYGTWRSTNDFRLKRSFNDDIDKEDIVQEQMEIYESNPRIMLMDSWTAHLEFHQLLNKTILTCRKRKVDRLIIEAKTAGHSVAQELSRLLRGESFGISLETPKGDKDARLRSVSHLFEAGLIYRPNRDWAEKVADQCSAGSRGAHDELADGTSGSLRHLRQIGEASTIKEHVRYVNDEFGHRPLAEPLYDT